MLYNQKLSAPIATAKPNLHDSKSLKRLSKTVTQLFVALVILVSPALSQAKAPLYSQIMPKAKQSLLLDAIKVGDRTFVIGDKGHILYADNVSGEDTQWLQAKVPTIQMLTAIDFVDENTGWAVGHDGLILKTTDKGATWTVSLDGLSVQKQKNISNLKQAREKLKALKAQYEAAEAEAREDMAMDIEDAEYDIESAENKLNKPVYTSPLLDVYFADSQNGYAVGAFGSFWMTSDGGENWVDLSAKVPNEDGFHFNALTGANGYVFAAGEMGMVIRSKDKGATWETLSTPYDGTFFTLSASENAQLIIAAGLRGNAYYSTDQGATWSRSQTGTDSSIAGAQVVNQTDVALVGNGGAVLISKDGAKNFKLYIQENRLPLSSISKVGPNRYVIVGLGGVKIFSEQPN